MRGTAVQKSHKEIRKFQLTRIEGDRSNHPGPLLQAFLSLSAAGISAISAVAQFL